jgi:hypothetical protein
MREVEGAEMTQNVIRLMKMRFTFEKSKFIIYKADAKHVSGVSQNVEFTNRPLEGLSGFVLMPF